MAFLPFLLPRELVLAHSLPMTLERKIGSASCIGDVKKSAGLTPMNKLMMHLGPNLLGLSIPGVMTALVFDGKFCSD